VLIDSTVPVAAAFSVVPVRVRWAEASWILAALTALSACTCWVAVGGEVVTACWATVLW